MSIKIKTHAIIHAALMGAVSKGTQIVAHIQTHQEAARCRMNAALDSKVSAVYAALDKTRSDYHTKLLKEAAERNSALYERDEAIAFAHASYDEQVSESFARTTAIRKAYDAEVDEKFAKAQEQIDALLALKSNL